MKALNNIQFVSDATTNFNQWINAITQAETYDKAVRKGEGALGFIDCMTTYLNCMICWDNNDFTGDLGDLLDNMTASVYQHVADKARETNQPNDVIMKLLEKRDEYTQN